MDAEIRIEDVLSAVTSLRAICASMRDSDGGKGETSWDNTVRDGSFLKRLNLTSGI